MLPPYCRSASYEESGTTHFSGGKTVTFGLGGGYRRQHEAFEELLAPLDAEAAEDLRWRTACRAYGLD